ncbi:HEXXH motif-containing putative peptide modification protein [Actinoplanes sp. N902-109]|uniref:aKG-HExxH-type peptide beta-hydroxylase n=1 Tax=Actinoplanes sp. (strain N902-109) TaxID=649831 RepID=UPI00032956E6|nr:HEXXH motif-containing putative peptide modification protein [Actinoplanes sp. N902-109]AGL14733.1 hypothetical protein L083_1223 [Actinoplanes sp. N902-109]
MGTPPAHPGSDQATAGLARARPHRLTDAALTALGAGRPDPATVAELHRAQLSRHLLLLREIAIATRAGRPEAAFTRTGPDPVVALAQAERTSPGRVRELLGRPLFGAWATGCLTALRAGAGPVEAGLGHLSDLALAAQIPQQRDRVLSAGHDGLAITARLEDADPLRARLGLTPTPPLTAEQRDRWQRAFSEAWRLLVTAVRPDAEVLAAVLDCVVPVQPDPAARGISATSAEAFGAVAISEPADATALAVGLLHETQHSILNAVQYLFDLLEAPDTLGYSPWRDDPRPASGILHGAYAYLTVTRFWRTRRDDLLAQFEFARWRAAVVDAAGSLRDLTPAGARFVGALLDEVRPWLAEPVDPRVLRLAQGANRDHYLRWRLRNRHVDPADAEKLVRAFRTGEPPPAIQSALRPAPRRALEASTRLDLAHRFLRDRPLDGPEADVAYVRGDNGRALSSYRRTEDGPHGRAPTDWAGLLLAGGFEVAPEIAAVLDGLADPIEILRWLG